MKVRPATLQQIGEFLTQRSIAFLVSNFFVVFSLGGLRGLLYFGFFSFGGTIL
jgi:hypothetical protein